MNRLVAMFIRISKRVFAPIHDNVENSIKIRAYRKAVSDNASSLNRLHEVAKEALRKIQEVLDQ